MLRTTMAHMSHLHTQTHSRLRGRVRSAETGEVNGSWRSGPRRTWLIVSSAAILPVLYLAFVWEYSVDSLQFDDWNLLGLLTHPTWGGLWSQYGEPRIPITKTSFLVAAHLDGFNTRTVTLLSAMALIGAYFFVLACFSEYLDGSLTPLAVLTVGVVWFSLADTQNALWAFQFGWYLVLLWLSLMLFALLVPHRNKDVWFAVAMLAAVLGSLTWSQGFLLWPVGLIALLWPHSRSIKRVIAWCAVAFVMVGVYLIGYDRRLSSCSPLLGCRPESALAHPLQSVHYFLVLLGEVIPASYTSNRPGSFLDLSSRGTALYQTVGVVVLTLCVYVIVASIRQRNTSERLPLPLLLIVFALLFDAIVTWGRVGEGPSLALTSNRYSMIGLVATSGLVVYGWRHISWTGWKRAVSIGGAALIAAQVIASTAIGWTNADNTRAFLTQSAQVVDNVDRLPIGVRQCELNAYWVASLTEVMAGRRSGLAEFAPDQIEANKRAGLPALAEECRAVSDP